ncbi:MAG: M56 family peptidase [Kytococcus sp.]|uniref:M56 family metallopeptidase n=1 Tax=Janibacter terrae TaxID=103817 RepID=UPI0008398A5F|nr:M56 family metallopeptidase [Janibacter terrae]MBA4084848.1 M56 family peptidase [Kytococcus sp.]
MIAALLLLCAAALLTAPRLLVRIERLRRSPRAALLVWQSLSLSAVLCLLTAAPVAWLRPHPLPTVPGAVVLVVATLASTGVLVRLLGNGHSVGTRIRAARAAHRQLVDIVGRHEGDHTRVLPSHRLSAYCVPGAGSRLVITEAALAALPDDQLAAVVSHEEAHLRERHDLVLEFFTVLHTATPAWLRTDAALREVALLVEVLADRAAREEAGEVALGRAILSLAEAAGASEPGVLGVSAGAGAAATRIRLLVADDPAPWQTFVLYGICVAAFVLPAGLATAVAVS